MIVIGVLAAVAVPTLAGMTREARITSLASNVAAARRQLDVDRLTHDGWPTESQAAWLADLPPNPLHPDPTRAAATQVVNGGHHRPNPTNWNLDAVPNRRGYWYNPNRGAFCARTLAVAGTDAAAVFARVNGHPPQD